MSEIGFGRVIGQHTIKQFLKSAIKNSTLSHAYIFEGSKGIGKRTMANAFATALVCEENGQDSCGLCKGCMMAETKNHPDIVRLACAEDKRSIGVDEVRGIIADAYIKPYYSSKKVFLVEDADLMTEQAQNAILKIFEEPPLYVVFILLAKNSRSLLETVRSRGMMLTFSPYTSKEVTNALHERVPQMEDNFDFLVAYSYNNIGRALELATDELFMSMRKDASILLPQVLQGSGKAACTLAQLFEKHKDYSDRLFEIIISLLRDILFLCIGCKELTVNADLLPSIERTAQGMTLQYAVSAIEVAIEANERIMRNVNYNLSVMAWLCTNWEDVNDRNSGSKV